MINYITHKRYRGKNLSGSQLNLPYGTKLIEQDNFIYTLDGKAICTVHSEVGQKYFSINEDNLGLERGKLTYEIAFSSKVKNGKGVRFSDEQIEILEKYYSRFLRKNQLTILFNDDFFKADIKELEEIKNKLKI